MTPAPPLQVGESAKLAGSTVGTKLSNGQMVWLIVMIGSYAALLTTWVILALIH